MPEPAPIHEQPAPPEREKQRPLSPETSRLIVGALIPEMLDPASPISPEQTQKFKSEVTRITPEKLHASAIADLAGEERKQEYDTYEGWSNRITTWFENQNDDAKDAIKGTFARLGIDVNDHLEQDKLNKFFDEFVSMEGSQEDYRNRYDKFVKDLVSEFVSAKKKVDRNGLADRVKILKPLLTSFGNGDMVEVIEAHINALGFISQDDQSKGEQADEVITNLSEDVRTPNSLRGLTKLFQRVGAGIPPQPGKPRPPTPDAPVQGPTARDEDEIPTEKMGQPKTEAELDKLLQDAQVKLGRPLNDSEKIYVAQTGDINKLESVDIDDLLSSIVSAQKNSLEHGVFEPAFQRIQELAKKGNSITPEEIEEHNVLVKKLSPAQVILASPEEIDVFATVSNFSPDSRQNILNSYRSFDANTKKPDKHLTTFIITFEKDEEGKPQIQPLIPDYIPADAEEPPKPDAEHTLDPETAADALLNYQTGEVKDIQIDYAPSFINLVRNVDRAKERLPNDQPVYILSDLSKIMIQKISEEANNRNGELAFTLQGVVFPRPNNNDIYIIAFVAPSSDFSKHSVGEVDVVPGIQEERSKQIAQKLNLAQLFQQNNIQEQGYASANLHVHQNQLGETYAGKPSKPDLAYAEQYLIAREQHPDVFTPPIGIVTQTDDKLLINIINSHRDSDNRAVHQMNTPVIFEADLEAA